jgi:hypothetical protein
MVCSAVTISQAAGIGSFARCAPSAAADVHQDFGAGRHHRAGAGGEHAAGQHARGDVDRVRGARGVAGGLEHALVEHVPGAVVALLAGLEHEDHVAAERVAAVAEQLRRSGEERGVQVVPARVHDAVHVRAELRGAVLPHRQRVHVPAQQDGRAGGAAAQHRGDRVQPAAGIDLQAQAVDRGQHLLLGARQDEAEFGLPVQGAAQVGEFAEELGGVFAD